MYIFVSVCSYPRPPKEETQYDRERAHTHTPLGTQVKKKNKSNAENFII